jgi:hypothetical protein
MHIRKLLIKLFDYKIQKSDSITISINFKNENFKVPVSFKKEDDFYEGYSFHTLIEDVKYENTSYLKGAYIPDYSINQLIETYKMDPLNDVLTKIITDSGFVLEPFNSDIILILFRVFHEIGHVIHFQKNFKTYSEFNEFYTDILDEYSSDLNEFKEKGNENIAFKLQTHYEFENIANINALIILKDKIEMINCMIENN